MKFGNNKLEIEDNTNDTMLPIMSLMLILIPFLVGNIAFFQLDSFSVNTPGMAPPSAEAPEATPNKPSGLQVMSQLKVDPTGIELSLINEATGDTLDKSKFLRKKLSDVSAKLIGYRKSYPKLDALLVSVEKDVKVEMMAQVFSKLKPAAAEEIKGSASMNIVLLPRDTENE